MIELRRWRLLAAATGALTIAACGAGSSAHRRVHTGMTPGEVLVQASGWLSCVGYPVSGSPPESLVRVSAHSLEIRGFGAADGTFRYGTPPELGAALETLMRSRPGSWTFLFGYVAIPKREYFDVVFDAGARVTSVSEVRWGGLD